MTDDTHDDGTDESTDRPADVDALADCLRERVVPLATTDPAAPADDLDPLPDALTDATVVGLGEATHGTREFFQLKHRLVRHLVADHGVRLVAMEANFAEATAIDDYVTHGEGTPEDGLAAVRFWTWDTEEVLALLEWLRAFNAGRPADDRVRFVGIDAQFTAGAAETLREYLEAVDPGWLADHREGMALLADEGVPVEWTEAEFDPAAAADAAADARATVDALAARFEEREAAYVAAEGEAAYRRHQLHLRTLDQAVTWRATSIDDTGAAIQARDEGMADNLRTALDLFDAERAVLWAHDEHLRRDARDTEWGDLPGTGTHLAREFGADYYAVGFDFARGAFQALDRESSDLEAHTLGPPPGGAATPLFDAVGESPLFVDFEAATADPELADWLGTERPKRSLGAWYYGDDPEQHHDRYVLPEAFDGLLFVADTERARPIARDEAE